MPRIIRHVLYRKLRDLAEMREFQRDFQLMSGLKLAFMDELGMGDELEHRVSPLCGMMHDSEAGRAMCARARQQLLSGAGQFSGSCGSCDAGLNEVAIPVKIGGICAGFLMFGGTRPGAVDRQALQKVRHLLRKHGIPIDDEVLGDSLARTREASPETLGAYRRMVELFVRQISLKVTDSQTAAENQLPPVVVKACRFIQSQALIEDIQLGLVARHCGVSEGHLSRAFHHSTGLTFRSYLAHVRVEHAKTMLLRNPNRNVTEIAYESGFQSLSQFHRVFQQAYGTTPGKMRHKHPGAKP